MFANSLCRDPDTADSSDKGYFSELPHHAFQPYAARRRKAEIVRTTWVTRLSRDPECLRKSWWEERVDAVTQAVEAVTNAAQNAEKEKKNQPESVSNE